MDVPTAFKRTAIAVAAVIAAVLGYQHVPDLPDLLDELTDAAGTSSQTADAPQAGPLPVAPEDTGAHYDRDDWPHWTYQGDGCDMRDQVLIEQGRSVRQGDNCKITEGTWLSSYDGATVTDPGELDIDHMVPLAEVMRSGRIVDGRRVGPRHWTEEERERYANDPEGLIAVTAATNRAKGDQDPADWLPERDRCGYVRHWVEVKHRYKLSADQDEARAIANVLDNCPGDQRE